jgi:hypothetical protein
MPDLVCSVYYDSFASTVTAINPRYKKQLFTHAVQYSTTGSLKGQCHEFFYSGFFHQTSSPSPDRHA